jgi:hypothetical protein
MTELYVLSFFMFESGIEHPNVVFGVRTAGGSSQGNLPIKTWFQWKAKKSEII